MKDSFIIFIESWELVSALSPQQRGTLLESLFRYAMDDELPQMDGITAVVFASMRQKIDYANKRYEEIREKRSAAGVASGRARRTNVKSVEQNEQVLNVFNKTNLTDTDTDTVTVTVTDTDTAKEKREPPAPKCPLFEHEEVVTAWREYTEMRKKIKKPITTDRTKTMAINKLMELSGGKPEEAVKVLNQSVDHCWVGLFAIKEDWKPRERQRQAYEPKDERRTNYDSVMRELFVQSIKEG